MGSRRPRCLDRRRCREGIRALRLFENRADEVSSNIMRFFGELHMPFSFKYKTIAVLAILTAVIFVDCTRKPANGGNAQGNGGKKVVGFAQMSNDNPWRIAETKSMRDEADKRGYEIVVTDAQGQMSKQVSDVEDLIARRVDAIFLPPQQFEGI